MVESLREREVLYKLIISQLRYDGLDMVAANLAKCVGLETTPLSPSSRLLGLTKLGLQEEKNGIVPDMNTAPGLAPPIPPARGLDLEYEIEGSRDIETNISSHYDAGCKIQLSQKEVAENCSEMGQGPGIFTAIRESGEMRSSIERSAICRYAEEEVDLNAQPTMIACRGDVGFQECNSQVGSEHDFSMDCKRGYTTTLDTTNEKTREDSVSTDRKLKTEHNPQSHVDCKLSKIIDFDPRNKGKLTDRNSCSSEVIFEAFRPFREESRCLNYKELVSSELLKFGINQSIFAKTVLKRSQGYLSDLLNHQEAIFSMEEPSRMLTNFLKIKKFLDRDEIERKSRYLQCVERTSVEHKQMEEKCMVKISPRKKRVTFTKGVKDELRMIFKDRATMPDPSELAQISSQFGLEVSTIKNLFRNLKARLKIS